MSDIDNDKLGALVGKMLGDLGGAFSVPTARIGYRLGLFEALHQKGAASFAELAAFQHRFHNARVYRVTANSECGAGWYSALHDQTAHPCRARRRGRLR